MPGYHPQQMVLFWSQLQARPQLGRGRLRSDGAAPFAENLLKFDTLYALEQAPLEPLMLVLLLQQSTAKSVSVVEPARIPKLLGTLWGSGDAPTPAPSPNPHPHPYPYYELPIHLTLNPNQVASHHQWQSYGRRSSTGVPQEKMRWRAHGMMIAFSSRCARL